MKGVLEMGEAGSTSPDARILHRSEQIRDGLVNAGLESLVTIIRTVRGVQASDEGLGLWIRRHIPMMPNQAWHNRTIALEAIVHPPSRGQ